MEWSVGLRSSSVMWLCTRASWATSWKALAGVCAWRMAHGLHSLPVEVAQGLAHINLPLTGLSFYKHLWVFFSILTTTVLDMRVLSSCRRSSSMPPTVVDVFSNCSTCLHEFFPAHHYFPLCMYVTHLTCTFAQADCLPLLYTPILIFASRLFCLWISFYGYAVSKIFNHWGTLFLHNASEPVVNYSSASLVFPKPFWCYNFGVALLTEVPV